MWLRSIASLSIVVAFISATTVDLSNRGLRKEDFFVKLQVGIDLRKVDHLILRGNKFDSFLDCSTNMNNLKTLDLSQNHLQRFFFLCKEENNLKMLNVSHNNLEYIDDNALNDRVPELRILDLSYNKLTVVNETMLEHLTILEYLSLSHNPIGLGIHDNAFWKLTALKQLDLSNISAPYFSVSHFQTLTKLISLNLAWNPINKVPLLPIQLEELDVSGTQITKLQHMYQPNLRELKLNFLPNLTSLTLNDLETFINLEKLSMIGCRRLAHLNMQTNGVALLPRLQRLSIKESGLKTLGIELRPLIQRVPFIELTDNPWRCDCKMEWINLLNTTKNLDIRCDSPEQHHGKLLAETPNYELECEYDTSVFYAILWVGLAIVIIALIIVAILILLRRPTSQWSFKGKKGNTVTYTTVVESNNDLVRILAVTDHNE